ncbi:hypothetical protein BHYA_0147g00020 [Botrytis hyacinthi]|uniref:Uncharacterized protein n=1 Tax=Botrytis hyacinthi TaxID=278943 RepID=A0A4Z1GQ61_9HELO|nr:hypothetical protein BHYA_0147g00020 [Botrytis hyacinthi]
MARTAAGREVITYALKLQIEELEYVIARLIAARDLDIPTIQQNAETIVAEIEKRHEERGATMRGIVTALRILPGYIFRQLFVVDNEQSMRDTSSDWIFEEKIFVRDASEDSYLSDTTLLQRNVTPDFAEDLELNDGTSLKNTFPDFSEDLELNDRTPLRDTSSGRDTEEIMSVRDSSDDSDVSDTTALREENSSDFVDDSELSDDSSLI